MKQSYFSQIGACNTGRKAIVSSAFPHFGEESVLQGWNGSGTIFFGMCNLRCVFCQNWDISQKKQGHELDANEIADLMLKLQNVTKCHNINFVVRINLNISIFKTLSFWYHTQIDQYDSKLHIYYYRLQSMLPLKWSKPSLWLLKKD